METVTVASKRSVLVDTLLLCFQRSSLAKKVSMETLRSVLQAGGGDMWREGKFRLEYVWKILCQQPGISMQEIAPPMLIFHSLQPHLDVEIALPQALEEIPVVERNDWLRQYGVDEERFATDIQALKVEAERAALAQVPTMAPRLSAERTVHEEQIALPVKKRSRFKIASGFAGVMVTAALVATYLTFSDSSEDFDMSDVAGLMQLTDGKRDNDALVARIVDERWKILGSEQRKKVASEVYMTERNKGIRIMTLIGDPEASIPGVIATDNEGVPIVLVTGDTPVSQVVSVRE